MVDTSRTQEVFQLRKNKQLSEAYTLSLELFQEAPTDEWVQRAYAWVLVDIIKAEINTNINLAKDFFNQLLTINFTEDDEIITKQINFLRPKFDVNYHEVQHAENLSKTGKHTQSIQVFQQLKQNNKLSINHHEAYGWAIYRYIKSGENTLNSNEIKKMLFEYIQLNNERPSLLHSVILQLTVHYVNKHNNFDLYKFFQLWNPKYLRSEDKEEQYKDGKTYSSLVNKLLREFVNKGYQIDIAYLQNAIGDKELVIDSVRESYFWKIFNTHKENNFNLLWDIFNFYVNNFSTYGGSHWHSEILKIAERFMIEENSWRFYEFFDKWKYENLLYQDWQEEHNGEYTYKPTAIKALKKIFDFIKSTKQEVSNLHWVLKLYQIALDKFDNDIWIQREYATILDKTGHNKEAIQIYKNIIFDLNDQAYVWHEFSRLLINIDKPLSISMLCKAISIQKNEDFLGDIHLELAQLLIEMDYQNEAKTELHLYEKHRTEKGWKLSDEFLVLQNQLNNIELIHENNKEFYISNISLAEEYIYSDIPWTDLLLYDEWKTKENKERISFSNLLEIDITINKFKFKLLKSSEINQVYSFKLYFDKDNQRYIPLKVKKSSLSQEEMLNNAPTDIAIVDNVNKKKELFHYVVNSSTSDIIRFSQTDMRPKTGEFIKIHYFKIFNKKQNRYKLNILNVEPTDKINTSLLIETTGELSLKYKYDEDGKPDFAFINDYYIPKYLLEKHKIEHDCAVKVKVLFNGEKWSVFNLEVL